jgi:hypothetical protein
MSATEELRSYLERLRRRFRLGVVVRGVSLLVLLALLATVGLAFVTSRFAFSRESLWSARAVLIMALALGAAFGLAIPLWQWGQRWWTRRAERLFPQFEQRLLTFADRDGAGAETEQPFLQLLAVDTLRIAQRTDVKAAAPDRLLVSLLAVGAVSLGTLVWLIRAGPGYLGYGAAAIWTGPVASPLFTLQVSPGDATVRRHADQLVTAELPGLQDRALRIHVRYQSASKWEETAMQQRPAATGFQFLFAGIPEDVEYYVEAGSIQTPHFHLRVADIPVVKQIRVRYHHPDWTHLPDTVEEHGGDLRAVEGTEAELEVVTDIPLSQGVLAVDDGRQIPLTPSAGNVAHGSIKLEKDGSYHVAAREQRISEDYLIAAGEVKPPEVVVMRPERDYRASPIEEVTLAATANDPFGLSEFALHYSVNGGPEQTVDLMKPPYARALRGAGPSYAEVGGTATKASGETMLSLETLKLVPGDVIGFYAVAKDARSESHSDISFIQVEPFEREFSQSQQSGGGAGGGAADDQSQIAEREKEIIAATWKQAGQRSSAPREAAEQAKFLSDVQTTLRSQALSLAGRLQMRDLQLANEHFGSFQQDMEAAATAMRPAAQKLGAQQWSEAVFDEQKALQYLLRAESTFRQIQVAFGSAAGSGAVNSAGRDLASLFDLELDTQKNQYESAQSPSNQHAGQVEDALRKLDELARRQSELAARRDSDAAQSAEERWQQEMLRRKAEELRREMEQLARADGANSSGADSRRANSGESNSGGADSSGAQAGRAGSNGQQALSRLREAEEDMRRAVDENNPGEARRAADRLREAMNLLGGIQRQDSSKQVESLAREAGRLQGQQREQAERMRGFMSSRTSTQGSAGAQRRGGSDGRSAVEGLINDRQRLADDLARLTQNMRAAEHAAGQGNRNAAKKLREALGDLEQANTESQLQRSADQLRRGYAPLTDTVENEIASALAHLKDQLGETRQAMADSSGQPSSDDEALDAMNRLRSRLTELDPSQRRGGGRAGQGTGRDGGSNAGTDSAGGAERGGGYAGRYDGRLAGPVGRGDLGGNRGGPVNGGWNTGNNAELPHPAAPDTTPIPGDAEEVIRQGLHDLDQLKRSVGDDPAARREVDELVRSMQNLDPRRFPGNPAMIQEMYARVLASADRLELQLHHQPDTARLEEVRSDSPPPVPVGYEAAVGEYFRRLSKNP